MALDRAGAAGLATRAGDPAAVGVTQGASPMPALRLSDGIDVAALAARFAQLGHVRIEGFLDAQAADHLAAALKARDDWVQRIGGAKGAAHALSGPTRAAMSAAQADALDNAVRSEARYGFQYRYESIGIPDGSAERAALGDDPLAAFAAFMGSDPVLALLRRVTGSDAIRFADAQATAFGPGDFLTGHDDAVDGKARVAAYVLGLSPAWRPEWGGLLLLGDHAADGAEGSEPLIALPPRMNVLNLFAVPQMHSVSEVTRTAPRRRYAMTGWLRSVRPPD